MRWAPTPGWSVCDRCLWPWVSPAPAVDGCRQLSCIAGRGPEGVEPCLAGGERSSPPAFQSPTSPAPEGGRMAHSVVGLSGNCRVLPCPWCLNPRPCPFVQNVGTPSPVSGHTSASRRAQVSCCGGTGLPLPPSSPLTKRASGIAMPEAPSHARPRVSVCLFWRSRYFHKLRASSHRVVEARGTGVGVPMSCSGHPVCVGAACVTVSFPKVWSYRTA